MTAPVPIYGTPTVDGQVSVGSLLLGRDTPYRLRGFNPWARTTRHQQEPRAWAAGSWSGREDTESVVIPLRIRTRGISAGNWLALHWALLAAFEASRTDVELRYRIGGVEYLMYGRPRVVDPEIRHLETGLVITAAAFEALDPLTYSGVEHSETLGLPSTSGGVTVPLTVPFTIAATVTAGRVALANAGTKPAGLRVRIDANDQPLPDPRVTLQAATTTAQVLRVNFTLGAGQWLELDTAAHTARLNGSASRRGLVSGAWPLVPPGVSELAFDAGSYSAVAQLTATWRDAW